MHPLDARHVLTSSSGWSQRPVASRPGDSKSRFPARSNFSTKGPIHLLSVRRVEPGTLIRDALLDVPDFTVSFARDYRELWISKQEPVNLVLIHNSLCSFELEEAARLARGRWPKAKILIIRSGEVHLEDPLYDHRLPPPVTPKTLINAVSKLVETLKEGAIANGDR
jgi:hypothetical protein